MIKGKIEDIELPEKADVLISEPMGMSCVPEMDSFSHSLRENQNLSEGKHQLICLSDLFECYVL